MLCYLYNDMAYVMSDYSLHLLMLFYLYNDMVYVTSDTFAHQVTGHWTCALESGPLIGAPPLKIAGG